MSKISNFDKIIPEDITHIQYLLTHCGSLRSEERVLILCDPKSKDLAEAVVKEANTLKVDAKLLEIRGLDRHGSEPSTAVAKEIKKSDLTLSMCQHSLAHSHARINASKHTRFLSLPQIDIGLLRNPAMSVDFHAQAETTRFFADAFTHGKTVRIKSSSGTDVVLDITNRIGNYCPGFVQKAGDLGSPPDIEANISPIEEASNGQAIIDGSITCPEIGLINECVNLKIIEGKITKISSSNENQLKTLNEMMGPIGSQRRVLAECGIGLNPRAKLTGNMLTDEGSLGCIHFGFGANHTVGGKNEVDFHLDFVMRQPSLLIDDKLYLDNGTICQIP
jgi:2,5-dihydroxypyridine 5,6-dioxygenase